MLVFRVENAETVGRGEGKDTVSRVPGTVKYFVAEVENVDRHLVLLALVAMADSSRLQRLLRLAGITRRLERDVTLRVTVKQSEVIVVRTSQ